MAKPTLKQKYEDSIRAELAKELGITNAMAIPNLTKIVVNAGIGKEFTSNSNVAEDYAQDIALITGQKPAVTKSKKAVSNFKLRENTDNGLKVTLRGDRMWEFYYKLVNIVLPRVKDFRGVSDKAFDKRGNYALGIKEHTVFPEIDTNKLVKIRTLQVIICTSAQNDDHAKVLLQKLGMPFKK
ncbi:MAG: 50S ribosomal protein L5 [Candidatus Doudnabacteria bacterium]|nr:50S ribosomal protein L5 [Candidatus Doudnabacteria bacterium]